MKLEVRQFIRAVCYNENCIYLPQWAEIVLWVLTSLILSILLFLLIKAIFDF